MTVYASMRGMPESFDAGGAAMLSQSGFRKWLRKPGVKSVAGGGERWKEEEKR